MPRLRQSHKLSHIQERVPELVFGRLIQPTLPLVPLVFFAIPPLLEREVSKKNLRGIAKAERLCRICAATLKHGKEREVMEDGLRLDFWTMGLMRSMEWRVGGEGKGQGEKCMHAIRPKPDRHDSSQRMVDKPRNERRNSTLSTSSSIFDSGLSPELSSSSLDSESDFDFDSEPPSEPRPEPSTPPWFPLLTTHIPAAIFVLLIVITKPA